MTGCIRGVGQGFCRSSDGDSDGYSDRGDGDYRRGMGGSSYDARTRSGPRLIPTQSSGRKRSRGNAALGASTTRSRSGSRSGLVSGLRRRRLRGERSDISRGGGSHNDDDRENGNDGNIGDDGKDGDNGGGGRRGSGNFNGNVGSADSGMMRGGKG